MREEKTTADYMNKIACWYLENNCDHCPFYEITKTCDSVPIGCTWLVLGAYFRSKEQAERKEE